MATGVDAKLLKSTKFPAEFNQKVDMQKVNLQVMKKWIANRVTEILGSEDDVVIELIFNLIEGGRYPDIKSLQIQLTGFLDKDTPAFCKDLWKLLLSAQASPQGVPKELLEAKKLELMQEKIEADKAAEEARQRREEFERRDRGRGGRGGGGPGRVDSWRGGRDDRDRGGFGRGGAEDRPRSSRDDALASSSKQDAKSANELRERELKEKIKKMRSSKSGDDNVEANAT
ncbi:PWI domain-containing protein [Madurella fahalii]|uniref:PWI domain-containing protein n=1 Tax=Madurella fahalii TaxID=1157608 RepID=A0ABQ0FX94_9PEZI